LSSGNLDKIPTKYPVLVGPTGVGKSEIAFRLAKVLEAEILSVDAYQVYRDIPIGTAQPPIEWQHQITHHLIGCRESNKKWNAAEFAGEASKIISNSKSAQKQFIIVGGSGFYLNSLISGIPHGVAPSKEIRNFVSTEVEKLGNEKAYAWLKNRDPHAAQRIHVNDRFRICRALEKYFSPFSPIKNRPTSKNENDPSFLFFGFERSKENLDKILKLRTDYMWANGLMEETQKLRKKSDLKCSIWKAIGYQEMLAFLNQEISEIEAKAIIFRRTRQYAKRQWTWFKHHHSIEWINLDRFSDIEEVVLKIKNAISI
jgi:tRNA dimethylallyltransferase